MYRVVDRQDLSSSTYLLEIEHPMMARAARPGQFVIAMLHERSERIPLTIADFDRERGTITLVIQAVGKGTKEMQLRSLVGSSLLGLVGPMGVPSRIDGQTKVACVGGGLGVAPVFPQLRAFKEAGAYTVSIVGFRTKDLIFWADRFERFSDELVVCTDDGSAGLHGQVTRGLEQVIEAHPDLDLVIAIGPPIMMQACAETTRPHGIHTVVSLNPIMVDGTGMCGGCRVTLDGQMKLACVDGPDFDAHQVDFEDLMSRLRRYRAEEALSERRWTQECRLVSGAPEQ